MSDCQKQETNPPAPGIEKTIKFEITSNAKHSSEFTYWSFG